MLGLVKFWMGFWGLWELWVWRRVLMLVLWGRLLVLVLAAVVVVVVCSGGFCVQFHCPVVFLLSKERSTTVVQSLLPRYKGRERRRDEETKEGQRE